MRRHQSKHCNRLPIDLEKRLTCCVIFLLSSSEKTIWFNISSSRVFPLTSSNTTQTRLRSWKRLYKDTMLRCCNVLQISTSLSMTFGSKFSSSFAKAFTAKSCPVFLSTHLKTFAKVPWAIKSFISKSWPNALSVRVAILITCQCYRRVNDSEK